MMAAIIGVVGSFAIWLLGKIFPSVAAPNPAAENANALLQAKVEGDAIQDKFDSDIAANPGKLREPDKFELK